MHYLVRRSGASDPHSYRHAIMSWVVLSDDVILHIMQIAPLTSMRTLLLLESRSALLGRKQARLSDARRLLAHPFCIPAKHILSRPHAMRLLDLSAMHIGGDKMKDFCRALMSGAIACIEELYLHKNHIDDEGMQAFSAVILRGELTSLTHLSFENNRIGDIGMVAFSDASSNRALIGVMTLSLGSNLFGNCGMRAFSRMLIGGAMPSLKNLYLHRNGFDEEGAHALSAAIVENALPALSQVVVPTGHEDNSSLVTACQIHGIDIL